MPKKGQAAMEFLMTYGWAILVVLIAIGALAYFGVLNPSRFLPESCTLIAGFSCDSSKVTSTGAATLIIRNGMGDNIYNFSMAIDDNDNGVYADANEASTDCVGTTTINDGDQVTCNWASLPTADAGSSGSKYKANVQFTYN